MKAILVFDVGEFTYEAIEQYFTGDIALHLGAERFCDFKDVILQPMPEELPSPYMARQIQISVGVQSEKPPYTEDYQKGYNDCIYEILGEE